MSNLMPIGRFSKMTRLSVKALRHYDQTGLLVPAFVDPESSYRYYETGQAARAEAIRTLRTLDMPLDQIAQVLDGGDRASLLATHRTRLSQQLGDYERKLRYLTELMTGKDYTMTYNVAVKELPAQQVVATKARTDLEGVSSAIPFGFGAVIGHMHANSASPAGIPFIIYHDYADDAGEFELEICVPVTEEIPDAGEVYRTTIPGGSAATTVHTGPYDQLSTAYHALGTWIQEHGHEAAGPPREVYLNDPSTVEPEALLTEIQWPIS